MIKLKKNAEQLELIKAMGSKNKSESIAAQEAFAAAVGPVIGEVLMQVGTASMIFEDYAYGEDESPIFPLDFLYGEGANAVTVWSASKPGGLASNWVESSGEVRFMPYTLDSAVNFDKKYARKTFAFNVLSKAIERMVNEVLIKQERQAWATLLRAVGEARTNGADHIIAATTANRLQLDDFNRLITLAKRINQSYANGTPSSVYSKGVTDLFMSFEMMQEIRGMAYQPMSTLTVPAGGSNTPGIALPENMREEIYKNAGASSIYGIGVNELAELGIGQKYNILYNQYAPGGTFTVASDEIIVGLDLTKGAFIRAVETNSDSTFSVQSDDQFAVRSEKVGFFGSLKESRVVLDGRACSALIV
jgi:hypothetical protein